MYQQTHQLVVLVASRSKNCQKVEESSKNPKNLNDLKNLQKPLVWRNIYQSTDPPPIRYKELELLLEFRQFFELLLLGPDTLSILLSNWLSTKQTNRTANTLLYVFNQPEEGRSLSQKHLNSLPAMFNNHSTPNIFLQSARLPFAILALE